MPAAHSTSARTAKWPRLLSALLTDLAFRLIMPQHASGLSGTLTAVAFLLLGVVAVIRPQWIRQSLVRSGTHARVASPQHVVRARAVPLRTTADSTTADLNATSGIPRCTGWAKDNVDSCTSKSDCIDPANGPRTRKLCPRMCGMCVEDLDQTIFCSNPNYPVLERHTNNKKHGDVCRSVAVSALCSRRDGTCPGKQLVFFFLRGFFL